MVELLIAGIEVEVDTEEAFALALLLLLPLDNPLEPRRERETLVVNGISE